MKIVISKPLKHKGVDVTELDLKLDELTGRDLTEIETQMNADGKFLVTDFSKGYQARVAARSARIPFELIESLPARDFSKVVSAVQLFLVGSDSSGPESTESGTPTLPAKS